jgi:hypothetical protein
MVSIQETKSYQGGGVRTSADRKLIEKRGGEEEEERLLILKERGQYVRTDRSH